MLQIKPLISVIICSSDKHKLENCIRSLKAQLYPKDRIQTLVMRGYMPEGKDGGKAAAWKLAKGEYVLILDEDNVLEGNEVINNLLSPLENDKTLFGSHCMLRIDKNDPMINRYVSLMGTDPMFAYRSLDGKFGCLQFIRSLKNAGAYYVLEMRLKNLLVTGGNVFLYRKSMVDEIGGYTQDTDNTYVYTQKHGKIRIAIPKQTLTHHMAATSISNFLTKKMFWSKRPESRRWKWIPEDFIGKVRLAAEIICNLTIIVNIYTGIKNSIRDRENAWMLHPWMAFATTWIYAMNYMKRLLSSDYIKPKSI